MDQAIRGAKRTPKVLGITLLVLAAAAGSVPGQEPEQISHTSAALYEEFFRDHISGPIVQAKCIFCHVEGGRSAHTRLVFVRESDEPDHEAFNLQAFIEFLAADDGHDDHERILTKIQGVSHGGGVQVPVDSEDFENMDHFLALLEEHSQGLVARLLEQLEDEGPPPLMFAVTTPAEDDAVAGNAVTISAAGAPTLAVHFAHRPLDLPDAEFTYLGAAANLSAASLSWDTSALMDGAYELAALYTEDGGDSITYDAIEVVVDNVNPVDLPDIVENDGQKTQALRTDAAYEVITADGVVVTVPVGALDRGDRITVRVVEQLSDLATLPGDAIGIDIDISLDSGLDTFREAVTIGIPYPEGKPDGLVDHTSIPEVGLSLWFFDLSAGAWMLIPDGMVQPDADMVVADVAQTGTYGIFNAPLLRVEQGGAAVTGLDFGAEAMTLMLTVANGNPASVALTWMIEDPGLSWLSVDPDMGDDRAGVGTIVTASVDRTGLQPGDYGGTLYIRSNGGTREMNVSMRVSPAPGGGGGCAVLPLYPGGPVDPTLMGLLGLATIYLIFGRRRLTRLAVIG